MLLVKYKISKYSNYFKDISSWVKLIHSNRLLQKYQAQEATDSLTSQMRSQDCENAGGHINSLTRVVFKLCCMEWPQAASVLEQGVGVVSSEKFKSLTLILERAPQLFNLFHIRRFYVQLKQLKESFTV